MYLYFIKHEKYKCFLFYLFPNSQIILIGYFLHTFLFILNKLNQLITILNTKESQAIHMLEFNKPNKHMNYFFNSFDVFAFANE